MSRRARTRRDRRAPCQILTNFPSRFAIAMQRSTTITLSGFPLTRSRCSACSSKHYCSGSTFKFTCAFTHSCNPVNRAALARQVP